MKWRVSPSRVSGTVCLPGDKSLSHRALILAAMSGGRSEIRKLSPGADVQSTADCLRRLGATIFDDGDSVVVEARSGLTPPSTQLFAGNSGTTMRLLAGVLAGQEFTSCLTGDRSLSQRPMERVAEPLRRMGASVTTDRGHAPIRIGGAALHGIHYETPVASAQIKSAILLAGVYAHGETCVTEPAASRDHTERMLAALGVPVRVGARTVTVDGGTIPLPFAASLSGDPSSAAFFLAAAALTGGRVTAENLLLNPTRTGFVDVLRRMGVEVSVQVEREELGEPVGTITVAGMPMNQIAITRDEVPSLIDELPLVALLGTQVDGTTSVRGAEELRVKETDRIEAVVTLLRAMGSEIEDLPDGFLVHGPTRLSAAHLDSRGDHRLAMMAAVAGLIADGTTTVEGADAAAVSFPSFASSIRSMGGEVDVG